MKQKGLPFSYEQFVNAVPQVCASDTAAGGGKGWTPDNPTWGHCAVVALWVQNLFGGDLLRMSLEGTPFAEARSHYFNDVPGHDKFVDLTWQQFSGRLALPEEFAIMDRGYVIGGADTRVRYARFGLRLLSTLLPSHKLLQNEVYHECIRKAFWSPCQKKGVGAVLTFGKEIRLSDHNRTIPGLESLCTPTCIRFSIPSRTESMLGSCGHAEERLLWRASTLRFDLKQCELFVAAVTAQGLPEDRPFPEFTCVRCAVAMHYADIQAVNVAYQGRWVRQTPAEALASAKEYALGTKKA